MVFMFPHVHRPIASEYPHFSWKGIPSKEKKAISHLQHQFMELAQYHHNFSAAVELLERLTAEAYARFRNRKPLDWYQDWVELSARDAAMTVFHIGKMMRHIRQHVLDSCPTIKPHIDLKKLKACEHQLDDAFPGWVHIRDAVAHMADAIRSPEFSGRNAVKVPYRTTAQVIKPDSTVNYVVRGRVQDGKLVYTHKGEKRYCDVIRAAVHELARIRRSFNDECQKAAEVTQSMADKSPSDPKAPS